MPSPWSDTQFVLASTLVIVLLVTLVIAVEGGVFGEFRFFREQLTAEESLIQPQTQSEISYVYANGQRIASLSGNEVKFYHNDYLGSSRIITDSDGVQISSSDNYPFGSTLSEFGEITKYKFTGKELDATGLQYFGARYYDSQTGRFTQIDPLTTGDSWSPNSLVSTYAYAANNPMKFIDPTGKVIEFVSKTDKVMKENIEFSENIIKNFLNRKEVDEVLGFNPITSEHKFTINLGTITANDEFFEKNNKKIYFDFAHYNPKTNEINVDIRFFGLKSDSGENLPIRELMTTTILHEIQHNEDFYNGLAPTISIVAQNPEIKLSKEENLAFWTEKYKTEYRAHTTQIKIIELLHQRSALSNSDYKFLKSFVEAAKQKTLSKINEKMGKY